MVSPPAVARPLVAVAALALLAAVTGGLLRAGALSFATLLSPLLESPIATVAGRAAASHAGLVVCGFLGTVIGIERAIALKSPFAFAAPLAAASGALLALAGFGEGAGACWLLAAAAFTGVNIAVVRRQPAAHTRLLLASALAWLGGCLAFAFGAPSEPVDAAWLAFLVLTIVAERLDMARLAAGVARRSGRPMRRLWAAVAALLLGATLAAPLPRAGGVLYGAALCLLAAWLLQYDIARRTVRAGGLARFIALCLLAGYGWLALGGLAWGATALGAPWRDLALHALGLGFVFGMVMGHAPVILPAIARIRLRFGWPFYAAFAALHGSLAARVVADLGHPGGLAMAAALNAAALLVFVASVIAGAVGAVEPPATRKRPPPRPAA